MIGVVTTSYPRWPGDPAGGFVAAHVAALRELGHDVEVIAAGDGPDDGSARRVPGRGLFYRGGAPDRLERPGAVGAAAAFTLELAAHVARRARRWDLAIAHWLAPSALAALPARVPLLAIAHGGDIHTLRRTRLLAPVLHALRARRARLAFVADELFAIARAAVPAIAARSIVQPMGIARAHFAALGRAPATPPTVLVAARLVPVKGVDVAIEAFARARLPARLVVAGDGPERAALERRAGPRVAFVGQVDAPARDRLLREAAAVVVPSRVLPGGRTEGTPLVALEALATGAPLVASAVGGLAALAPAAALVTPDDPAALARAIDRVLADPPAPDVLRAAVAALDWPAVASRLLDHAGG
jgi:glycosyltransferase involved in cell wall biosynthesis